MDAGTIRWIVTGAFGAHGLGMLGAAGYLPWSLKDPEAKFVGASWLLGNGTLAVILGVIIWAVAGAGFLAAAFGFWQGAAWWQMAAWVGSIFTLVAIGLWAGSVPFGVYIGGLLALGTIGYLIIK